MNQSQEWLYLSAGFLLALLTEAPPLRLGRPAGNLPVPQKDGWLFEEECVIGKGQTRAAGSLRVKLFPSSSACSPGPLLERGVA